MDNQARRRKQLSVDKWVKHIVAQLNSIESTLDLIATA